MTEPWQPDFELCGVIRKGKLVVCENIHEDPSNNFQFLIEDLEDMEATWHTHTRESANLSIADYRLYLAWPKVPHFITYRDVVRTYVVETGVVYTVNAETDLPSWLLE